MPENTESRRALHRIGATPGQPPLKRFVVTLAGIGFYHITDSLTGRVHGFRRDHLAACSLARSLER